jgi:hypothetical protein
MAGHESPSLAGLQFLAFTWKHWGFYSLLDSTFLLLASIEFDDLQTAQWLVEECGTRAADVRCNGWNIMHACAGGRTENSTLWFLSQDLLAPLCSDVAESQLT